MFEFGFFEMVVVGVVALVVLGPTRLPGLVRKVGRWVGKARSMAREFRDQLENEVNIEELNRAVKRHVMDEPPPWQPPGADAGASTPADAGASTPADAGASTPADAGAATPADAGASMTADAGASTPAEAGGATPADATADPADAFANSGYPYGVVSNSSASSADPSVVPPEPQPGDDDYSHAHAPGAAVTADADTGNRDADGNRRHDA